MKKQWFKVQQNAANSYAINHAQCCSILNIPTLWIMSLKDFKAKGKKAAPRVVAPMAGS